MYRVDVSITVWKTEPRIGGDLDWVAGASSSAFVPGSKIEDVISRTLDSAISDAARIETQLQEREQNVHA